MKLKLYIIIASFMMINGSTYAMGTFFSVARKMAFSKFMNRLQWAVLTVPPIKDFCCNLFVTQLYKGLRDADQFKSDYLKYGSKSLFFTEEELNKTNSAYIHDIIKDSSVVVKYHGNIEYQVGAEHNFITGEKYIILPYNCYIPEGILCHEYGHIKNNHSVKKEIFRVVAPVLLHTLFRKAHALYKGLRYGAAVIKNQIPSVGSTLLKIPSTATTFSVAYLAARYQSRKHEREADDAIPDRYALGAAQYLESVQDVINKGAQEMPKTWYGEIVEHYPTIKSGLEQLNATHPSFDDRIERLRARATEV